MLNETERAGRHRYEIDRIVDECFSERVTFRVKSAFQSQKDTPSIKRGVLGKAGRHESYHEGFSDSQRVFGGSGGPSREVAEKCLISRASIKEVSLGK